MMLLEDMKVVRLVSIEHTDREGYIICDITSDPGDDPWFHMAILHKSASQRCDIITKDGVSYHPVAFGTYLNSSTVHFALNDQPKIQEAIKSYVKELCR